MRKEGIRKMPQGYIRVQERIQETTRYKKEGTEIYESAKTT